jgi:hypothetical protein
METVVHNVRDLSGNERSAVKRLVRHELRENQQLVIQVVDLEVPAGEDGAAVSGGQLPDWCNVYDGLSDEQIADVERAISRRLDLTRPAT